MGSVFDGVVRKGELGGFGLENLGNVSKLNGTVKLAESFTPTELSGQRRQPVDEEFEEEFDDDEEFEERQPEPQQPKFFGDVRENSSPDFFGKVPVAQKQAPEKIPDFFPQNQNKATSGIPKEANFFGKIPKPKSNTPLIGNLKEGVQFFDNAFTRDGQKPPIKKGTGFDKFVGTIDVGRLSRGKPDSAVPLRGVFADKRKGVDRHVQFSNRPVDLAQMNRNVGVLPNPVGFDEEASIEAFEQQIVTENKNGNGKIKRKAGRPKGSLGKKKRIAKKITKTSKKVATKGKRKKKSELSKARRSLLEEQSRLNDGGAPRSALQANRFSSEDNSFSGLFS